MPVALDPSAIDLQQPVTQSDACAFGWSVRSDSLSIDVVLVSDPGTTVFGSHPLSFLLDVETSDNEQSDRE